MGKFLELFFPSGNLTFSLFFWKILPKTYISKLKKKLKSSPRAWTLVSAWPNCCLGMVWKENLCEKLWDLGWFVQSENFIDLKSATSGPLCHWAKCIKPPVRSLIPILIPLEVGLWKNHLILRGNNHAKFNIFLLLSVIKIVKRQMCIPPHQELSSNTKSEVGALKCAYHLVEGFF